MSTKKGGRWEVVGVVGAIVVLLTISWAMWRWWPWSEGNMKARLDDHELRLKALESR